MLIENAIIEDTFLGIENHGIFTASLTLKFANHHQGFGLYDLRHHDAAFKFIAGCLKVVQVPSWDALRNKPVRVKTVDGQIIAIANIVAENWFTPSEIYPAESGA